MATGRLGGVIAYKFSPDVERFVLQGALGPERASFTNDVRHEGIVPLFGVLTLPKVTLYGVWKGKGDQAWQREELQVDCRSPKVKPLVERDLAILDS